MENIKMQLSSQELKEYNKLREDGKQWYSYFRKKGLTHKQAFTEAKELSGINEDVETIESSGIIFSQIEFDEYQNLSELGKVDYKHYRLSRNMSHEHALLIAKASGIAEDVLKGGNNGGIDIDFNSILNKALEWLKQECRSAYNLIKDTIAEWWDKLKSWLAEVF